MAFLGLSNRVQNCLEWFNGIVSIILIIHIKASERPVCFCPILHTGDCRCPPAKRSLYGAYRNQAPVAVMANSLNRQAIEGLIAHARTVKGKQFELQDDREAGLRIRAGERSATWLLCTRLRNGKRSRIKLGAWPAMGLSEARVMQPRPSGLWLSEVPIQTKRGAKRPGRL